MSLSEWRNAHFLPVFLMPFSWQVHSRRCQSGHVFSLSHFSMCKPETRKFCQSLLRGWFLFAYHPCRWICVSRVMDFFVLCCLLCLSLLDHAWNYKLVLWSLDHWRPIDCTLLFLSPVLFLGLQEQQGWVSLPRRSREEKFQMSSHMIVLVLLLLGSDFQTASWMHRAISCLSWSDVWSCVRYTILISCSSGCFRITWLVSSHFVSKVCTLPRLSSIFKKSEMSRTLLSVSQILKCSWIIHAMCLPVKNIDCSCVLFLLRWRLLSASPHVGIISKQLAVLESNVSKSPVDPRDWVWCCHVTQTLCLLNVVYPVHYLGKSVRTSRTLTAKTHFPRSESAVQDGQARNSNVSVSLFRNLSPPALSQRLK